MVGHWLATFTGRWQATTMGLPGSPAQGCRWAAQLFSFLFTAQLFSFLFYFILAVYSLRIGIRRCLGQGLSQTLRL
jgi:hypothetical protein